MWTNKQHIMSRLGRQHDVIFVNFGAIVLPRLLAMKARVQRGDFLRPWRLLRDPVERRENGVLTLDFIEPRLGLSKLPVHHPLAIAATFDLRLFLLERYLRRRDIRDAILWVYHPGYGPKVARISHKLLVYDCVDEYSQFPAYQQGSQWLLDRERALCQRADVVFTTSQGLLETKRSFNPEHTYLVHNVGDAEHFGAAREPHTAVPSDIARLPKPVIGFVGAVSTYKLRLPWLIQLARERPSYSIVIIGPEGIGDPGSDVSAIRDFPNVHLLGHRPYAELPRSIKGFDVAVIPYELNRYTDACFPIKFFEFLATGKPVVISKLPALADYYDDVLVAQTGDEFLARCDEALQVPDERRDARIALARANSWPARVARLMELVEQRLAATRHDQRGA